MPSGGVNLPLCVLWEDELRQASKLLMELNDSDEDDVYSQKASAALNACLTALWGLTDERHVVLLATSEIRKKPVSRDAAGGKDEN